LQVLDDGRLTDNKGRTADFRNTIIIMTSNLGSHIIQEKLENLNDYNRDAMIAETRTELYDLLRKTIRPEFLNRIDEIIMFNPLTRNEISKIVGIQLNGVKQHLAESGIKLSIAPDAIEWIAQLGFDPQLGARPLKRVIQRKVLNELSKMILSGEVHRDTEIVLDFIDDQLVFFNKTKPGNK
jgi:ATP-dependent Clp protease ATP-binding subunit ClpB